MSQVLQILLYWRAASAQWLSARLGTQGSHVQIHPSSDRSFFLNFFRRRRALGMRISNSLTNRWRIRFFRAFQSCEKWGKRRVSISFPSQRRRSPMPSMKWSLGDMGLQGCQPIRPSWKLVLLSITKPRMTADDPQASLHQQIPLLFSLLCTAPPSNANFQGAREVSRPPLLEGRRWS